MINTIKDRSTGFILCLIIGSVAIYAAAAFGAPVMLLAIVTGLLLHKLHSVDILKSGVTWTSRQVLYFGVALMGLRIDFGDLSQAGWIAPTLVIVTLFATLFVGVWISRLFGQTKEFSILMSGATAICGVSAAAAICAALEDCESRNQELAIAVAGVTVLSTLVMIIYPIAALWLGLNDLTSGILMGGAIHNVSQAVGAGYAISPEAGDMSVLLKLMRVSMLLPIVLLISMLWGKNATTPYPSLGAKIRANSPRFLVCFVILAVLSCFHLVPEIVTNIGNEVAHWALVVSLVAIGIQTNMKQVVTVGIKPLIAMTLTTLFMAGFILAGVYLLGLA